MRRHLAASHVLASVLVLATGCSAAGGVKVTPEPPGSNCPNGGVRIDSGKRAPTYVCNGSGATVTPEPPGANCPSGGVRIDPPGGTPTYICDGDVAAAPVVSLCPESSVPTIATPGGVYLQVKGPQGPIVGDVTSPATGLPVVAVCDSLAGLPRAGGALMADFTVVTKLGPATIPLYGALVSNQSLTVDVGSFDLDATGQQTLAYRTQLATATLLGVEQITAADPEQPNRTAAFQRLSFAYRSYLRSEPSGLGAEYSGSGFTQPEAGPPCSPITDGEAMFLDVTGPNGTIDGDTHSRVAPGTIAVRAACADVVQAVTSGVPTGTITYGPLVVVKPVDKASVPLMGALAGGTVLPKVDLTRVAVDSTGAESIDFQVHLVNATVVSYEGLTEPSARLERLGFAYQKIEWQWANGSTVAVGIP